MLDRLKKILSKSRQQIMERVENLFLGKKVIDQEVLDQLEEALILSDVGIGATALFIEELRGHLDRTEVKDLDLLKSKLKEIMFAAIQKGEGGINYSSVRPFVIMVVGINGVGKTTTIAKIAHRFKQEGRSILLAAGDTFRAAAIEQLEHWGTRMEIPVVRHQSGSDPSAVLYDAVSAVQGRNIDILLADTAGRLHTKHHLMEEVGKMKRVMSKALPGSPHEVLLVLDATLGQNTLIQARQFHEAIGVTGIVLTKLDGSSRGGVVIPLIQELGIPVRFIGVGEGLDDLERFSARDFVESLID